MKTTIKSIIEKYGPSPAPAPYSFEIGARVRHVSGNVGEVIGRCSEFYTLNRSDFYRVRTDRGIAELYPVETLSAAS